MVQATTACVVKRRSPTIPWEQQQATRSASTHRQPNPIDQPNQNICPTSAPHFARPSAPCPCRTAQPLRPAQLTTASAPTSHRHTARRPPPRPAAAQQKPAHPIAPATGRILRPPTARAPARSLPTRPRPASGCTIVVPLQYRPRVLMSPPENLGDSRPPAGDSGSALTDCLAVSESREQSGLDDWPRSFAADRLTSTAPDDDHALANERPLAVHGGVACARGPRAI